jgi:hypothetical protein
MGGNDYMDTNNSKIHSFNTVQQLQTLLTNLTQGMDPCKVLVTGEANELSLYVTFREGAIKIGAHSDLRDVTSA